MKAKLAGTLSIALTLTMVGYMSLSMKSANAQVSQAPAGAGKTSMQNVTEASAEESGEETESGGCCSSGSLDNNPCPQAIVEKPCKDLMIAERIECVKQEAAKCQAKKKKLLKEQHPCVGGIVTRPCKDLTGMDKAVCIDKQIAACKAKLSGQ